MGTINSNGIFVYDDTESLSPLSSYMNLQGSALSTRLAQDVRAKKVANESARAAYVTEVGPSNISVANPLMVWRGNAPTGLWLERTVDGANWVPIPDRRYFEGNDSALTMTNGFSPVVAGGWNSMTIRDVGPLVIINGLFTRATPWSAGDTIGTVPAGWAPPRREAGIGIDVLGNGDVIATAPGVGDALVSCKVIYARPAAA